jgi:uracil-DNA glycosylase
MLLVGEAWGEKESEARKPFVGSSGKELFLMLGEALGEGKPSPDLYDEAVATDGSEREKSG